MYPVHGKETTIHSVWKKTIGIVLALVLCLGLLPTFTVAEGNDAEPQAARDLDHPYWLYGEVYGQVSSAFAYTFHPKKDTVLHALYRPLIEHGVLYARNFDNPTETTFVCGNENVGKYISSDRSKNGVVKLNIKVYQTVNGQACPDDDMVVTFRGYMILKNDATGHIETYYTEIRSGSYNHPNN